jgi:hypothetical protein
MGNPRGEHRGGKRQLECGPKAGAGGPEENTNHERESGNRMKTKSFAVIAGAFAMLSLTALAGPGPQDFPRRLATEKEAMDCCKGGGKVALACPDCKTVEVAKDAKGVAGWFKKDSTHGCAGCKGKITLQQPPGGKGTSYATSQHECSKGTKDSPYVCTDHKKA